MSIDLRDAKVLVTGGNGFLGKHLCRALGEAGARVWALARGDAEGAVDLTNPSHADGAFFNAKPDYVFHLAGYNGGIAFNQKYPADIFHRNTMMALNVLEACVRHNVKKVVSVVASCAYPCMIDTGSCYVDREILSEAEFELGPPHHTVACHGYAKRNLQLASDFYSRQYGLNAVCACPTTLYGPGDSFDPERTKVMGAMVKRFVDAHDEGKQEVTCWGTGAALREFLYVTDAAKLLVETMRHYVDTSVPLNLGTGQEISIKNLAETVARCVSFEGEIRWDKSKPDGQLRKRLDLTRMKKYLPEMTFTNLEDGIFMTAVDYFMRKGQ